MKTILKDYRSLFLIVVAIVIANVFAFIIFNKLQDISKNITVAVRQEYLASEISKQLLIELRGSENSTRSYYLTQESQYINSFYLANKQIRDLLSDLNSLKKYSEDIIYIDSISYFTILGVNSLKTQANLQNSERVIDVLDQLGTKIDSINLQIMSQSIASNSTSLKMVDTIKAREKKGFFKKLFSKSKPLKDTTSPITQPITVINKSKVQSVRKKLHSEITEAKTMQSKIIEETNQDEHTLAQTVFFSIKKLNENIEKLEKNESVRRQQKAVVINNELQKLKNVVLIFSVVISAFLMLVVFLVFSYIKRKNDYTKMLVKAQQNAEQLAKTKEYFLANMSHEIKTPLNAIYGFSESLLNAGLSGEQAKHAKIIKNASSYLTKLVNNILLYAKFNSGKIKFIHNNVNLKDELDEIIQLFHNQTEKKGIGLTLELVSIENNYVRTDFDKVKQILYNLIGNAIKFTDKGNVVLLVRQEKQFIIFKISDTGIGIDETVLPKLFNEYEQGSDLTHLKYGGTGLGLVITKKIIEEMGGQISIESTVNVGTTLTVTLPVEFVNNIDDDTPKTKTGDVNFIDKKNILIADDEEYNRLLLKTILTKFGAQIVEAKNGKEAVELVKNNFFDVVIMDARMPEMSGIDATKAIRLFNTNVPIIAATAVMSDEKIEKCLSAGMNSILFKPFSSEELIEKLSEVLVGKITIEKTNEARVLKTEFNINAIDHLIDDDDKLKREFIEVFYNSLNKAFHHINSAFQVDDYKLISEHAHKIIPSCKHFEAGTLINCLKFFEALKSNSNYSKADVEIYISTFNSEFENINKILKSYLQ